jgi:fucose 4-O-acetylase-like acetyltransferase
MGSHYLYFAAAANTFDKIEKIPKVFWEGLALGIVGIIVIFIVLRKLLGINKFVLGGAAFIAAGLIWFNWIYHRSEPKFLTPIIDRIAPFFPSAGAYETKQAGTPGK